MKILIVQDYLRSGGTERQSVLLANEFAAAGHEATLLTFRPGGPLAATVSDHVHVHSLQPFDLGLDWFAPRLHRFARRQFFHTIVCMGRMANCYAGGLQTRLPGSAVVATMRTGKRLPALFRASLLKVSHVVANSREARDTLVQQHRVARGKISVIYNSLVFAPPSALWRNEALRAEYGVTSKTTVLLCVAMFRPEKNQSELIEIVTGLPEQLDWQLWLAGDGPARAACEQLVAARQLGGRVKFLGFLKDPSRLYCAGDIAVHASWSEALSNFVIEAQAHGLLAVAYDAQGIRECFVPGRTGWVISRGDRRSFRDTLARRIREPKVTHAERTADARHYARTTFDRARQVAAYLELFEKLQGGAPFTP
jgi:glycosyltransferase involved in cell wall biosynthesis